MKLSIKKALFVFGIAMPLIFVLTLFAHKPHCGEIEQKRPKIPNPIIFAHPWISCQPGVTSVNPEMQRDVALLEEFYAHLSNAPNLTELMGTLIGLQKNIPFSFPSDLYNVLFITDAKQPSSCPCPYQIYQRLYLGDGALGLPLYLDVRVFDLKGEQKEKVDQILTWHLSEIGFDKKEFLVDDQTFAFLGTGKAIGEGAHGFAKLMGERGLFLLAKMQNDKLYVATTNARVTDFEKNKDLFLNLLSDKIGRS